eukprot:11845429-Prorocentrum_lima.AAC.1
MFRWNGNNDIVDYMAGTHILEVNGVTGKLLHVSPPCAGLQDVARDIRNCNQGASELTIDERLMNFYIEQ